MAPIQLFLTVVYMAAVSFAPLVGVSRVTVALVGAPIFLVGDMVSWLVERRCDQRT